MDHMNMLRERGTTIVLVSHNAALMRSLCDRVGWLDHGQLLELGDADHVIDAYLEHVSSGGGNTLTTRD
jgi:ABC-type polysaccharide/polyol phosphate transport system ATPase subunit